VRNFYKLLAQSVARRSGARLRMARPVSLVLMLMASPLVIVGAFGIAPGTDVEGMAVQVVNQSVDIAALGVAVEGQAEDSFYREDFAQKGDSLGQVLGRLQVDDPEAYLFVVQTVGRGRLDRFTRGRTFNVVVDRVGLLQELRYRSDDGERVVRRSDGGFHVDAERGSTEQRVVMRSGRVSTSLFAATDSAGVPDSVAAAFAELFSGDVDLHRDLRRGDRFSILYEVTVVRGEEVAVGRIVAAELINQGTAHSAIYFERDGGEGEYFTPSGISMKRSFLRSPLEFSRITSGFSSSRFHPVLQAWRAHKGIDYGAPLGARVRSTATGIVEYAGWRNGYGQVVVLRHDKNIKTLYGHLSAIMPGLRAGVRVDQGDVIGLVGMTGLASGPHLHYEFQVNGSQADPLISTPDEGFAITSELRAAFGNVARERLVRLALLRSLDVSTFE
jgi:murein DD-endopeptidase MepM/ murein hydrolase activator NlpD